jgi:hypothetical protein
MNMSYDPPNPPCPPAQKNKFFAECVVVCDRYHDFLGKTLPHNKYLFDKMVVVTAPEDLETQRICEYWHVECLKTDAIQSRWKKFCKGCGINVGLAHLAKTGWVVHMDADILLPPQSRIILEGASLDQACIYGIDRFNVRGFDAYADFMDLPQLQHEANAYVHMNAFELGTRVMHDFAGGYVPLGFFQMWDPKTSGVTKYPETSTDAGRTDTLFAQLWPRSKRSMIPEIVCYHLESEDASMAKNWNGRCSLPFTNSRDKVRVK